MASFALVAVTALLAAAGGADHRDVFIDVHRAGVKADAAAAALPCSAEVTGADRGEDALDRLAEDDDAVTDVTDTSARPLHLPQGSFDVVVTCPVGAAADGNVLVKFVRVQVPGRRDHVRVDFSAPAFVTCTATNAQSLYVFDGAGRLIAGGACGHPGTPVAVPSGVAVRASLLSVNRHIAEAKSGFLMPQSSTTITLAAGEHRTLSVPAATGVLHVHAGPAQQRGYAVLTVTGPRPMIGDGYATGVVAHVPVDVDFRVPAGDYLINGEPVVVVDGKVTDVKVTDVKVTDVKVTDVKATGVAAPH